MIKNPYKKIWIFGILIIFLGASILPGINGKTDYFDIDEKNLDNLMIAPEEDTSTVTLFAVGETQSKENKIDISTADAEIIFNMFKELKEQITQNPNSEKTQDLRNQFVSMLDEKGMLPKGVTKNKFISLLSPPSLNQPKINTGFNRIFNLKKTIINPLFIRISQILENRFNSINPPIESYDASATLNFCTIASYGDGYTIPVMIPPRPRIGIIWNANYSETYAGEVFSNKGFYAEGQQSGSTVGFTGGGGTFAFPGAKFYVFVGYTWHVTVSAEHFNFYPPNQPPVISDENPTNGAEYVPLSLSELSFRISDLEGERMDYTVITEPDIGVSSGTNKGNGVYSVPISGLEYDKMYTWTVELTDGNFIVERNFIFYTPIKPPFDPFNEGWHYRKKITIDHNMITGDLDDFPVLISIVDSDLKNKAQDDGDDILFMDDIGVASKLFHEIEKYESSTGELVAWVRVPSLSSIVDIDFYIYYGNPDCSSQQYRPRVWDSDYMAVWHMNDGSNSDQSDSTNNNHNLFYLGSPSSVDGKIGYAIDFDGSTDYFTHPNHGDFLMGNNMFTFSTWVKSDKDAKEDDHRIILYKGEDGPYHTKWYTFWNARKTTGYCELDIDDNTASIATSGTTDLSDEEWHYIVGIRDQNELKIWVDGIEESSTYIGNYGSLDGTGKLYIGRGGIDKRYLKGVLDELIIIKGVAKSDGWITTVYNNQNAPLNFIIIGPEEI